MYTDIDSDDDFITCQNCNKDITVTEEMIKTSRLRKKCEMFAFLNIRHIRDILCESCELFEKLEKEKKKKAQLQKVYVQKQKEEKEKHEKEEKEKEIAYRQSIKNRWDSFTIFEKIVELECDICYKLHGEFWNSCRQSHDCGLGKRLALYADVRFEKLQKYVPVYEQAQLALYNYCQQPHNQIQNPYEKKDKPEKILSILLKWLAELEPDKIRIYFGFPKSMNPAVMEMKNNSIFNVKNACHDTINPIEAWLKDYTQEFYNPKATEMQNITKLKSEYCFTLFHIWNKTYATYSANALLNFSVQISELKIDGISKCKGRKGVQIIVLDLNKMAQHFEL